MSVKFTDNLTLIFYMFAIGNKPVIIAPFDSIPEYILEQEQSLGSWMPLPNAAVTASRVSCFEQP